MAKRNFWPGILAMVLIFGIWFTACDTDGGEKYDPIACDTDGGEKYDPIVYTGKDSGGNTYKLEINKNTGKAAFTPASGDHYTLTITYANGTTKTSTGKVQSYSSTTITFVGAASVTFTVTVDSSGTITKIEGTIPFDDNTTVSAPGVLTPPGSNSGDTETTPPEGGGNEPTPPAPPANPMAGTTWVHDGTTVQTLTFTDSTWSMVEDREDGPFTWSGPYTIDGNSLVLTPYDNYYWYATVNGNTLVMNNRTYIKQ